MATDSPSPGSSEALQRWQKAFSALAPPAPPDSPRGRILAAARDAFAQGGFDSTPTRAIAERAGVNLAMVHYYFGSKAALYRRLLAVEMGQVFRVMAEALSDEKRPPLERLLNLVERIIRVFREDPVRLAIIRREMGQGAPHALALTRELGPAGPQGLRAAVLQTVEQTQATGEAIAVSPQAVAALLLVSAYGPLMLEPMLRIVFDAPSFDAESWNRILSGQRELLRRALVSRSPKESGS